jgi:hypothetical protein
LPKLRLGNILPLIPLNNPRGVSNLLNIGYFIVVHGDAFCEIVTKFNMYSWFANQKIVLQNL